jgi:hypothetical protein
MSKRFGRSIVALCAFAAVAGFVLWNMYRSKISNAGQDSFLNQQAPYSTYVNVRFAYSVCYPPQVLLPQGESPNGDGQKFVSKDNQATAIVYGSNNALGQSLQQVFDQDSQDISGVRLTISNKNIAADKFTFTGTAGNLTVVKETLLQNQQFKTFNIEFPTAAAATWAPVAQQMAACFANTKSTEYSN